MDAKLSNVNKLKSYKIGDRGKYSKVISLPQIWVNDNFKKGAGSVDVHRVNIDGADCLVIKKSGR